MEDPEIIPSENGEPEVRFFFVNPVPTTPDFGVIVEKVQSTLVSKSE